MTNRWVSEFILESKGNVAKYHHAVTALGYIITFFFLFVYNYPVYTSRSSNDRLGPRAFYNIQSSSIQYFFLLSINTLCVKSVKLCNIAISLSLLVISLLIV
jgi:hypothetical protein